MAFGGLKGTLTGNAGSITNPAVCSGSVAVAVGDLIVAVCGQQTNLTVTACSDNLGNTYSAQNAGTDGGTPTGRMFYSRVTVAGTLTAVNFTTTASTNDWAGLAAVIEGPVRATPLDTSPANITSDVTSPFTCPASGTLAIANEIVIAWGVANQSTVWAATSPNLLAGNANNSTNIKVAIGYQAVTATTSVSPAFTAAANPTQAVLGTASFRRGWEVIADAGSYALTGAAAALELDRQVVAAAGAYALDGQAATISKGLTLDGGAGSYALSGAAAALEADRQVEAAAGSYALTGADAGLSRGRDVVAAAGSYAVSGAVADLQRAQAVVAGAGSYALTGQAAAPEFDRQVVAEAGGYAFNGAAAALERARDVVAGAGSYALSGADLALLFGRQVVTEIGAYVLGGADAGLVLDRLVQAGGGAYQLAGIDADLAYQQDGETAAPVEIDTPATDTSGRVIPPPAVARAAMDVASARAETPPAHSRAAARAAEERS